jgi:hypothetical protein
MLNTTQRPGYKNRHTEPLPNTKEIIKIITNDISGEHIDICEWHPHIKNENETNKPGKGYLGTARTFTGIGFHAWQQNDSEFVYYKILKKK